MALSLVVACGPAEGGSEGGDDGGDDATTGSGSASSATLSSSSADGSGSSATATTGMTTGADATTVVDSGSGSGDGTDTGVIIPCGFEEVLCGYAMGKEQPIDCGTVALADPVAAWMAAHDCAVAASAATMAFKVAFQLDSDDSTIYEGFYGVVGVAYGRGRVYMDTFGDPMLSHNNCGDIIVVGACAVGAGTHCLDCTGAGNIQPLDCAP